MVKKSFIFIQTLILLFIVRFTLSLCGIKAVLFWLAKKKTPIVNDSIILNTKSINYASRLVPYCSCFVKAVAFKMSMSNDIAMKLVIGVIRNPSFASHAWIVSEDKILFGKIAHMENYVSIVEI